MTGRPILTAAQTREAEAAAIAAGASVEMLMERAGAAAAEAIERFAGPLPALILCGPGNNGGDGYVVARRLRDRGIAVRVAAFVEPKGEAAISARRRWEGPVEPVSDAAPAPLMIDALFGTGLTRPLDGDLAGRLVALAAAGRVAVAIDLPSGVGTDDGALLSPVRCFDLTITFASLKPAHLLQPSARYMGRVAVADIGIAAESRLGEIGRPRLTAPGPDDHKYRRGTVAVVAGQMPGACALAASAAARAGAGYVRIHGPAFVAGLPLAIVQGGEAGIDDARIGAIAIGPGLGRSGGAEARLEEALAARAPAVIDADALTLLAGIGLGRLRAAEKIAILTPHQGEFERLFPGLRGSKVERALAAAAAAQAVIVYKGPDSVVAAPDGRAAIAGGASHWLASAGTGDVLTGIIAAMRARGLDAFDAACAGLWLHGRAASLAGPAMIADDLLAALPAALASCA
jgi:hydroxyethylthiazole kinase-like uncharacterized protein yjeF